MKRDFFRKVGFGLGLDEAVPDDPLAWAQAQMDVVPPLSWKGDIPSGDSLMDHTRTGSIPTAKCCGKGIRQIARPTRKPRKSYGTKRVSGFLKTWSFVFVMMPR